MAELAENKRHLHHKITQNFNETRGDRKIRTRASCVESGYYTWIFRSPCYNLDILSNIYSSVYLFLWQNVLSSQFTNLSVSLVWNNIIRIKNTAFKKQAYLVSCFYCCFCICFCWGHKQQTMLRRPFWSQIEAHSKLKKNLQAFLYFNNCFTSPGFII